MGPDTAYQTRFRSFFDQKRGLWRTQRTSFCVPARECELIEWGVKGVNPVEHADFMSSYQTAAQRTSSGVGLRLECDLTACRIRLVP